MDGTSLTLLATAVGTVYIAAVRASTTALALAASEDEDEATVSIDGQSAAVAGVVASAILLLNFYFFHSFAWLLLFSAILTSTYGIFILTTPVLAWLVRRLHLPYAIMLGGVCGMGSASMVSVLSIVLAMSVAGMWLWSGHWVLNDLLGIALVIVFVAVGRLQSLRVAAILLTGLLLYDVFWVFMSEMFFGENVMVAVASKEATNPVVQLAETIAVTPPPSLARNLSLPAKLIVMSWDGRSGSILGLGDLALPGMILAMYRRAKLRPRFGNDNPFLYFNVGLVGYAVGLEVAMIASNLFHAAQPALLYIVPATILPVVVIARMRGEFHWLWVGDFDGALPTTNPTKDNEMNIQNSRLV